MKLNTPVFFLTLFVFIIIMVSAIFIFSKPDPEKKESFSNIYG